LEELKRLSDGLAKKEETPHFIIAHDSILNEIDARLPTTEKELKDKKRIGKIKYERYGEAILKA